MLEKIKITIVIGLMLLVSISNIQYNGGENNYSTDDNINYKQEYNPLPSPDIPDWFFKPSYKNSTWGVPDFDQRQSSWKAIGAKGFTQYSYDGPTALLNCLWWMDCKYNNDTESYLLPNFFSAGNGSKDYRNVIPTIDWLAGLLNTTLPMVVPGSHYGTDAANMTQGINNTLEYYNATDMVCVVREGYADSCYSIQGVNYSNITYHLARCDDVILLLGMYTWDPIGGFGNRIGGHYVQVSGYNTTQAQLAFADPFYDMGEAGLGWASTHGHGVYGNGSHNFTTNVSYDFYIMNITSNFGGGAACEVTNYPADGNATNWSNMNWAGDCIQELTPMAYKTVVEVAWYLSLNKSVDLEKYVWNGTTWSKYYTPSAQGQEIKINLTVYNTGESLTEDNLTIIDTFYDNLRYVNHTANITFSKNGTTYRRDADQDDWEEEMCSVAGHGHVIWNIPFTEIGLNFSTGDKIWIEFNVTNSNGTNYSMDRARAYICEFGFEYWDSTHYSNYSYAYIGSQFNSSINCTDCMNETSTWAESEHIHRAGKETCYDERWFEYETDFDKWMSYNSSIIDNPEWDWVYRYDDRDGEGLGQNNLSYTIANGSSINRSLDYVRMRYNITSAGGGPGYEPSVGIIYAFSNDSYYDMVLYSYSDLFLLSVDNGQLVNTVDRTPVYDEFDAIDYYDYYWCWNTSYTGYIDPYQEAGGGVYAKTLYSEVSGELKTKAWSSLSAYVEEPPGWIYQDQIPYIVYNGSQCFGLVVWDTNGNHFTADFDFINDWRLNYTLNSTLDYNQTTYMNHSGIPFMHIKATNKSSWENEYFGFNAEQMCYWFGMPEAMSLIDFIDIGYRRFRNLSNQFNMESKLSHPPNVLNQTEYSDNQNDTVYYYAGLQTGIEMMPYRNQLVFNIQDTTDGSLDSYDACVLAIDVDNNHTLDANDLTVIWWWDGGLGQTSYTMYYGTTPVVVWGNGIMGYGGSWFSTIFANSSIRWVHDYWSYLPVLHRLSPHRMYECAIPLNLLEKFGTGSMQYLNENDTFGLHLMTVPYNWSVPDIGVVWENYNETNDDVLIPGTEDENWFSTWDYYMNISNGFDLTDFYFNGVWVGVNNTNMQYWGHARLGDEQGYVQETSWETSVTKWANISVISNTAINNTINYTINISNTGEQPIGNVTVNESFPAGVWYVGSSLPLENVTSPYDNFYIFNATWDLGVGETISFNITVNISAGWGGNGSYVWNFVNVTNNNSANSSTNASIKYGTNTAPRINWQYPIHANTSTPILLANISANVTDAEGDLIQVHFYTNKSINDSWTPSWNCIGGGLGEVCTAGDSVIVMNEVGDEIGNSFKIGSVGANVSFNMTGIKVWMDRDNDPGWIFVNLTTLNGDEPDKTAILSHGNINSSAVPEDGGWVTINMTARTLTPENTYVFIMNFSNISDAYSNLIRVYTKLTTGGIAYPGGAEYFNNTGAGWWNYTSTRDINFEVVGWTGNITAISNQTFNNSARFNTRWRWGASYYYWYVNATDGKTWTNESYYFKTDHSRYDVEFDGSVNVFDLNTCWYNGTVFGYSYLGVYDVNADVAINVFDLNEIWTNHT